MTQDNVQLFDLPDEQAAIRARCFHPTAPWYGFPRAALEQSIVARFEQMVSQFPNRLAVKQAERQLTYTELNGMANGVAQALLEQRGAGVEPIALLFEQEHAL
ncbi:MAG: hypothetical protein NT075_16045 [Chloroflexi bacterium]|nr:hypothetical protein [Chloroflexota bacterium]